MLLVVAATEFEAALVPEGAARVAVCGIGPVEAALATAHALASEPAAAVLQIGVAGARSLPNGALVLGSESVYCDLVDPGSRIPRVLTIEPDGGLLAAARGALPHAHLCPIGTTGRVGGGAACEVEAMEGFGVLRAAGLAGVPALEVRAISNPVAESDRARWRIDEALDALREALPPLLQAVAGA